jgi:hypothetical protein
MTLCKGVTPPACGRDNLTSMAGAVNARSDSLFFPREKSESLQLIQRVLRATAFLFMVKGSYGRLSEDSLKLEGINEKLETLKTFEPLTLNLER